MTDSTEIGLIFRRKMLVDLLADNQTLEIERYILHAFGRQDKRVISKSVRAIRNR